NLRRAIRLMLVTGQRRGEVLGMEEREIDRAAGQWTIPSERSKNGRPHVVPLSPLALSIIDAPPAKDEKGDTRASALESRSNWVFPSTRTGEPYRGPSLDHAVRDLFIARGRRPKGTSPEKVPPLANQALLDRLKALEANGKRKGDPQWED